MGWSIGKDAEGPRVERGDTMEMKFAEKSKAGAASSREVSGLMGESGSSGAWGSESNRGTSGAGTAKGEGVRGVFKRGRLDIDR